MSEYEKDSSFDFTIEEVKNFGMALLVMTAAFTAFFRDYAFVSILVFGFASFLILIVRELAHRGIAYFMDAYVELEFTRTGAFLAIFTAILAIAFDQPLIFLIPVYSEFTNVSYENWGFTIDVIWSKREYWFASVGILALILTGATSYFLGYERISLSIALFTLFQMLPLRETSIVEESTDGAYILLYSGFIWLLFFGASIVGIALSI